MIEFQKLKITQRQELAALLETASHRGCGYSFANLYLWGRQCTAMVDGFLVLFSHYSGRSIYPYPVGTGDVKPVLDAIIHDAQKRGIPCRITGMTKSEQETLDALYPGKFCFHCDRDNYDYVYDINDLADLKGRRFQQKRNHVNRFTQDYPDAYIKPLDDTTLPACRNMVDNWYYRRQTENPHEDFRLEQVALDRAFRHYKELGMEGLVLYAGGKVAAMTMGSFLAEDTVDVHFEKADADIPGAYGAINRAFARYIRDKYPQVKYLNREDDVGSPGLRKAKLSYNPHHMVEKYWAHMIVEELDD